MIGIGVKLIGVKVPHITGRIDIDTAQALDGKEPRFAGIADGSLNVAVGQILVFASDGNAAVLSKADNDRLYDDDGNPTQGWDVKVIGGVKERERIGTITLGPVAGDGAFELDGANIPIEPLREEADAAIHFNKLHARYTEGLRGRAWVRRWTIRHDGVRVESGWYGPEKGYALGSQA